MYGGDKDMHRMTTDEGNFTSSPSPDGHRSDDGSFFDDIEGLVRFEYKKR